VNGRVQATCQGVLSAGLFFFVANAKPREALSRARPHQSVFCVYVMASLLMQFALQIGLIITMYLRAKALMDPVRAAARCRCRRPPSICDTCFA
jgi:hypothetical protein